MVALSQRCLHNSTSNLSVPEQAAPPLAAFPFGQKSASLALCTRHKTTQDNTRQSAKRPRRSNSESPPRSIGPIQGLASLVQANANSQRFQEIQLYSVYRRDPIPISLIITSRLWSTNWVAARLVTTVSERDAKRSWQAPVLSRFLKGGTKLASPVNGIPQTYLPPLLPTTHT